MVLWPEIDAFVPMPKPTVHFVRFDDESRAELRPVFGNGYSFQAGTLVRVKNGEDWIAAETLGIDQAAIIVRRSARGLSTPCRS